LDTDNQIRSVIKAMTAILKKESTLNTINSKSKHNIPSLPKHFAISKINNDVIVEQ